MFSITLRQAWILAAALLILDILVLTMIINRPVAPEDIAPAQWDFRISEVRQIEVKTLAAELELPVELSDSSAQPNWLQPYFPQAGQIVPALTRWQVGFAQTSVDHRP